MPDSLWLPLTANRCFLARQDRWRGTLVLTSTLWAAFGLNSNGGAQRLSELGPDFARCGFVQASHCVFDAFFPGAGGFNSVYGSGIPSLAIPGLRIFGPFHLGSWSQYGERKSDNHYETGRRHRKKSATVDRKEGVGFHGPGTFCHGTARSVAFNGTRILTKDPTAHQNVLFSFFEEASFVSDTIFDESGRIRRISMWEGLSNGRKMVDGLGQWFLDSGLRQDFGTLDMNGIRAAYRTVKIPPPCCLGTSAGFHSRLRLMRRKIWHQNDRMFVQNAMIRLKLCASSLPTKLTSTATDIHLALSQ